MWGTINGKVYKENPHSVDDLIINIKKAQAEIIPYDLIKIANSDIKTYF